MDKKETLKPGSTRQSAKYRDLMAAGKNLFWKHGFRRVSVAEVCEEAGASKMTFYRSFENKMALVVAILDEEHARGFAEYKEIMSRDIPFPEKIHALLLLKLKNLDLMSDEFTKDLMRMDDPEIKAFVARKQEEGMAHWEKDFAEARAKGWIRKEIKPPFIRYMQDQIIKLTMDPVLSGMFDNHHDLVVELTRFFFYGIAGHAHE